MSESLVNGKKTDTGAVLDGADEVEDSSTRTTTSESVEKFMEEELNSQSLMDYDVPCIDEQLSPNIQRSSCDTENSSIFATDQFPDIEMPVTSGRFIGCNHACAPHKESLADIDDWFADGYSFREQLSLLEHGNCCVPENDEETQPKSPEKYPEAENPQESKSLSEKSAADSNSPSPSELLTSVVQSYREALKDQTIVLANQTDALNRLATAIEIQTKMIDELHKRNRSTV